MVMMHARLVVGAFANQAAAVSAVHELREIGITDDQIALVARECIAGAPAPPSVEAQKEAANRRWAAPQRELQLGLPPPWV